MAVLCLLTFSAAFPANDLYKHFRALPARQLWDDEVPKYDQLSAVEREKQVALVRAIGVKFANSQDAAAQREVAHWLLGLLDDQSEKVRRYATAALPKVGGVGGAASEQKLLELLANSSQEREKASIAAALSKIGGAATLSAVRASSADQPLAAFDEQRVRARVARKVPSAILLDALLPAEACEGLRLHLRCRRGLEEAVADELRDATSRTTPPPLPLRCVQVRSGCVVADVTGSFSLGQLHRLRCFDTVGFVLRSGGDVAGEREKGGDGDDALAAAIASPRCEQIMRACTEGSLRYRLSVDNIGAGGGGQGGSSRVARDVKALDARIARIAKIAYARNPRVLNDARQATWMVDVPSAGASRGAAELRPRLSPNPRLRYQTATFYAGAHPPLAASMARMARPWQPNEIVWDPFCGTAMELIECALASPRSVTRLIGTDLDSAALKVAEANVAAAARCGELHTSPPPSTFIACDFRDGAEHVPEIRDAQVSLMISHDLP